MPAFVRASQAKKYGLLRIEVLSHPSTFLEIDIRTPEFTRTFGVFLCFTGNYFMAFIIIWSPQISKYANV